MAYADDVLITARTKQSLSDTFQQLKNNSTDVGLTINKKKIKYLLLLLLVQALNLL